MNKQDMLEQHSKAWMAVVSALNSASPDWLNDDMLGKSGLECAVDAIKSMQSRLESLEQELKDRNEACIGCKSRVAGEGCCAD